MNYRLIWGIVCNHWRRIWFRFFEAIWAQDKNSVHWMLISWDHALRQIICNNVCVLTCGLKYFWNARYALANVCVHFVFSLFASNTTAVRTLFYTNKFEKTVSHLQVDNCLTTMSHTIIFVWKIITQKTFFLKREKKWHVNSHKNRLLVAVVCAYEAVIVLRQFIHSVFQYRVARIRG